MAKKVLGRKKKKVWANAERHEAERLAKEQQRKKKEAGRPTQRQIEDERAREELRRHNERFGPKRPRADQQRRVAEAIGVQRGGGEDQRPVTNINKARRDATGLNTRDCGPPKKKSA